MPKSKKSTSAEALSNRINGVPTPGVIDADILEAVADEMCFVGVVLGQINGSPTADGISGPSMDGLVWMIHRWGDTLRTMLNRTASVGGAL